MAKRATYNESALHNTSILVKMEVKTFGTVRKNKRASSDVCVKEGAHERVAAVIQQLFDPSNAMLKEIMRLRGLMRNLHVHATNVWDDEGFRIIKQVAYGDYKEEQDELISKFDAAVEVLVKNRDDIVNDAKQKLGNLFDPDDYPSASDLRERYSAKLITQVLPNTRNAHLEIGAEYEAKLREEAAEEEKAKLAKATDAVWHRVYDEVTHMRDALSRCGEKGEGDTRAKAFRDSLVPRMQQLAAVLPQLNIADDPKLADLAKEIAADLCVNTSKDLRADPELREEVREKADEMLDALGGYMGGKVDD